jgi:hypothetical protein
MKSKIKQETEKSGALAEEDAFFGGFYDPLIEDFQAVGGKEGTDEFGGVAIGKKEADGVAGAESKGFAVNRDLPRRGEFKIGDDAFQSAGVFHGEVERAIVAFHAKIEEEGEEPFAGEVVVIEGQNVLDAGGIIGARGEIGAEEEIICGTKQRGKPRQDDLRLEVGNHTEEGDEPRGVGMNGRREDFRQIIGGGEVADERMTFIVRQGSKNCLARDENHGDADIGEGAGGLFVVLAEQLQQAQVFLAAAAAEGNQMNAGRADLIGGGGEGSVIGRGAIGIGARRGKGIVESEPLLGLFDGVVVELVVDLPRAEGLEQIATHLAGELARMDGDLGRRRHGRLLPEVATQNKAHLTNNGIKRAGKAVWGLSVLLPRGSLQVRRRVVLTRRRPNLTVYI